MIASIVCLAQVTIVTLIAWLASATCLPAAPRLASRLSWLGIVMSTLLVTATLMKVPRPWTIASTQVARSPVDSATAERAVGSDTLSSGKPALGIAPSGATASLSGILDRLYQLRARHPIADYRVVAGVSIGLAVIASLVVARFCFGFFALWQIHRGSTALDDSVSESLARRLAEEAGLSIPLQLRRSSLIASPCVSWLRRGTIYVPGDFCRWSPPEREVAIAHEVAHEVRRDAQYRLVADLCTAVLFFHPLSFMLRRQLVFGQELATDRQAAELMGSVKKYQRGLSMLALRVDSQTGASFVSFGVSVSTNHVVRRIKMLSSVRSSHSRWQEIAVAGALICAGLFTASWTAQADEPIRIAALAKSEGARSTAPFAYPVAAPWEPLGQQDGFAMLRPGAMSGHAVYGKALDAFAEEALAGADLGLDADNIALVRTNLTITLRKIPEEQRTDDKRHMMMFGADAFDLATVRAVDWAAIAQAIPLQMFGPPEPMQWLVDEMVSHGQTDRLRLVSSEAKERQSEHTDALKRVWQAVDGGVIAFAFATPANLAEMGPAPEDDPAGLRTLMLAVDSTAVGIDLQKTGVGQHFRLAFAPQADRSAEEVVQLFEACRQKGIQLAHQAIDLESTQTKSQLEQASEAVETSASTKASVKVRKQLLGELEAARVEIVRSADGAAPIVVVHMTTQTDMTPWLFQL